MSKNKMPYKDKTKRKEHYEKNKPEINRKRRKYFKENLEARENKKKREAEWRNKNREKLRITNRIYSKNLRLRNKQLVFEHYGNKCVCCGESNIKFLTIDHIEGKGRQHRKKINNHINRWLVKSNYPKGFQVLCYNCNCGKRVNKGICPHKEKVI